MQLFDFIINATSMSWLKANRVSVKDPFESSSPDSVIRSSVDSRAKPIQNSDINSTDKIKSNPSFSLQRISTKLQNVKANHSTILKRKDPFKLPSLKKGSITDINNPEEDKNSNIKKQIFYQSLVYRSLTGLETTYIMTLARQHFYQTIQALRITRNIRVTAPKKQIKLQKKSSFKKTIYLDLDQTLIHTDQRSNSYSVKLTFPIQTWGSIQAGVRIRPFCKQFLEELAKIAEVIIFTASSSSYADVILNYLDPQKRLFAHRLYRNHCTLQKGFYIKDLRTVNRKLQDVAIVDNSAFSYLLQPENGIPILPYYHFAKDQQLISLLGFLKQLIEYDDVRNVIRKTFFLESFIKDQNDPKQPFIKRYKKEFEQNYATAE